MAVHSLKPVCFAPYIPTRVILNSPSEVQPINRICRSNLSSISILSYRVHCVFFSLLESSAGAAGEKGAIWLVKALRNAKGEKSPSRIPEYLNRPERSGWNVPGKRDASYDFDHGVVWG